MIAAIDEIEWLHAVQRDPDLTAEDRQAALYYADFDTDLTDEQIQGSFDKLIDLGYFAPVLVLNEQPTFDIRRSLPRNVA